MVPVLTPEEMGALDRAAPEALDVLVSRAGGAVAREAMRMMGGGYGRRVVVVAGKGNNGADGREAARRLELRGVRVSVVDAKDAAGRPLPPCDLVIDAAYGTGFKGEYISPDPGDARVLAVDMPSGVDGLTGQAASTAVRADRTVTFAALKPGLLLGSGAALAGSVSLVDIGLDARSVSRTWLVDAGDVASWLPVRPADTHKWKSAVWVVAGSPGMTGAARLCAAATLRAGAGTVRLGVPGSDALSFESAPEIVGRSLPGDGWENEVVTDLERSRALVVGPGLGRTSSVSASVRRLVCLAADVPAVIDADALWALGDLEEAASVLAHRRGPTVLTPHEGEFARLTGAAVPADRLGAVRELAARLGVTVLLKGSVTLVGEPDGTVLVSDRGGPRLATAGTGDVLAGIIGAFLAMGVDAPRAAAAGAYVHGSAARLGWERGFMAGDLLALLPQALAAL